MAIDTVAALLESLRGSPILRPDQYQELVARHAIEHPDAQELVRHLIKLKWLTVYQAKKILAGKANELVIGNYTVLDKLGEGGMGRVYKAVQLNLNRIVALKVVRSSLLKNEIALKRFRREVKAAAALSHPNIVRVFDADQEGDRHFLAMEHIEGADLGRLIKDHGPLPVPVACSYIRQAALGLQHAHDLSFVHRDIKPSNLLVAVNDKSQYGPRNVVKILDMGLARTQGEDPNGEQISTELTRTGTVVGTPDYMSPEQAKNSSNVDSRSDLYSLGCTFYYLLTGEVVFPKGNPLEKLLQHQLDAPRPIQLLRMDLPPEVASIIQCLLAKKPEQRFQSGSALAHALEPWCASKGQSGMTAAVAMPAEPFEATPTISDTLKTSSPFNFDDEDTEPSPALPVKEAKSPPRLPKMPPLPGEEPAPKKSPIRLIALGAGIVLTLFIAMLAASGAFRSKPKVEEPTPSSTTVPETVVRPEPKTPKLPEPTPEPKTPAYQDIVEKYIPDNTVMVLVFDVKNFSSTNVARQHVWTPLTTKFLPIKLLTGVDLFQLVERVIVSIPPKKGDSPMVILQGRSLAGNRLIELAKKIPNVKIDPISKTDLQLVHFPPDKKNNPEDKGMYAVLSGPSLLLCENKSELLSAIEKRDGAQKTKFYDPTIEAGLNSIYRQPLPFAATAVFGLKGPFGELSPAGKDLRYFISSIAFDERGMHFYVAADEAEQGKGLEFQKAIGTHFKTISQAPGKEDRRLEEIAELFHDAKFLPFNGSKLKAFVTHHLVRVNQLERWLKPFFEDTPAMNPSKE